MSTEKIEKIMSEVKSLPSMPASGAKMLGLLEDPESNVDQIEEVLRFDPGLTANILKLANSAYFGIPARVGSIRQAVILLGLKRLVQLVVASCVRAVMEGPVPGYEMSSGDLWRHSIAVSIAAEALVREKRNIRIDDIFTPALLHDIGKVVLGRFVKDDLDAIEEIAGKGVPPVLAENMILGTDHAEVGARILEQWSFPEEVIRIVRWHHDPDALDPPGIEMDVVCLANALCASSGGSGAGPGEPLDLSPDVLQRLGIEDRQLNVIAGKVSRWVDELAEALTFA
jgi:putative nucleotidyltransferase with HDIG domain